MAGRPTRAIARPTVIVEAPVNGIDGPNVAYNAWQFRQILGRGVHGILLCQAESADAVKEFVRACRFPHHKQGSIQHCRRRSNGCTAQRPGERDKLGIGSRGRGSEPTAADLGHYQQEYLPAASPGRSTRRASFCSV